MLDGIRPNQRDNGMTTKSEETIFVFFNGLDMS
ncbi:hypothetical protein HNR39_004396 [Glaciimonas immobilis]|uniref:Uncharacterized protein n=1 Tax=Glaciimonas immobilis TaxID=728004 RepID=A0A840S1T9_9BURK|nr:hypothetical protein [Glaciimonas immobilis]